MALINSTKAKGSSATPSVAIPTGVVANVIVILAITTENTTDPSALWPAGFTEIGTQPGYGAGMFVAWKRATGSESGTYTMSTYGSSQNYILIAQSFSGRHITDPPVIGLVGAGTSGSMSSGGNMICNGVTAVDGDDLDLFNSLNYDASQAVVTYSLPAGFTEDENESTSVWVPLESAVKPAVTAGATGNLTSIPTWTGGTAAWASWLLRIPAAPGGGTLLMGQICT